VPRRWNTDVTGPRNSSSAETLGDMSAARITSTEAKVAIVGVFITFVGVVVACIALAYQRGGIAALCRRRRAVVAGESSNGSPSAASQNHGKALMLLLSSPGFSMLPKRLRVMARMTRAHRLVDHINWLGTSRLPRVLSSIV